MSALAELQMQIRSALVDADTGSVSAPLVGGERPERRLAIHLRHYQASLMRALVDRFPATAWLVGSDVVVQAARQYVRSNPPVRPCLAEYGGGFPSALAAGNLASRIPYLRDFAELEYRVGQVSLEVTRPARRLDELGRIPGLELPGVRLAMQPGTRYLRVDWSVDDLLGVYLSDAAPLQYEIVPGERWLEIRGSRGDVTFQRLSSGAWTFRAGLANGLTLGDASARGLAAEGDFQPGSALRAMFDAELVVVAVDEAAQRRVDDAC